MLKRPHVAVTLLVLAFTVSCSALPKSTKQAPVIQNVNPAYLAAGSSSILLSAAGQNFMQNSVVLWNGVKLATSLDASGNLRVSVPGTRIANPGTATVSVQNPNGLISNPVTVTVLAPSASPLVINTTSMPSATYGTAYNSTVTATGGTPLYTCSLASGSLPPGLALSASTCQIVGTPGSTGTYGFSVRVTDSGSPIQAASQSLSIVVGAASAPAPTPLSIATSSLPSGTAGTGFSATLVASGGTPGYTWSIGSGSLPGGLILSGTTGQISGIPSASGSYNFIVVLSDSGSPQQSTSKSLSISVVAPTVLPISITTTSLPSITVGMSYSVTLSATGGIQPYTWSLSSGTLPAGLTLSGAGVISGIPTAEGTNSFTVQVIGSAQ